MLFAGRQYVVRANVVVNWNGILQGSFRKIRAVRVEYNTISSVVYEGNGGEATEYAAPLANGADSVPVPGVFDSTQLQPHLMRTEILPRRKVKHDETNLVHALSDVRVDPDWRTDVQATTHVWYCRDMAADRNSCQLKGMSSPVAAAAPTTDKLDSFWPSPSPGDEDNLPDGTPLTIPPHGMQDEKDYTFTLMSIKSKRKSLPDMGVLSTANRTCPSANIEAIRGRVNPQFLYRIYGGGASTLGTVQFKWTLADTQPLSAPSLSAGATTAWLDKAYFSVAKNTMVAGREYKLTLNTRAVATASDPSACMGSAERIVLTNVAPRPIDGISFEPAAGGVEFNTTFTVECGQWVDTVNPKL